MDGKQRKRLEIPKEELARLYQFHSCNQIAKQFGVTAEVIRRRLHEYGVPINKVGGRRAFDPPKEVLESFYQRMSMRDMATHFGVGETVVWKRLREHGIELKEHTNHRLKPGRVFSDTHKANIRKAQIDRGAVGDKNPNWRGGLTDVNRRLRQSWQYREWRDNALRLRGCKCQDCGVAEGHMCECCGVKIKLHVHHVLSFAKFPESRFDPANSEVLCPKCHYGRHRTQTG
ncbi:MAG: HNH endonuclease [Proteobacteria bacterium]|nr:HNH endonuclease [Pseudomonadota bacterium]